MNNWTSNFFSASNGTKLHYYRTGGDKPSMMLIHGITDDALCWTRLAKDLEADYDIIMLDQKGHGRSGDPDNGYDFKTIAAEVADLVKALGLEKPILMGHSLGAMTSLSVGVYYPDLPRALLLEDPPPFWKPAPPAEETDESEEGVDAWLIAAKRMTIDELFTLGREDRKWSEEEIALWANAKHRFSPKLINVASQYAKLGDDYTERMKGIPCPTLLLSADPALGAIIKPEDANDLRQSIPQFQHINIPNAGHSIHREQYNDLLTAVRTFLKEI